ncbi:cytochrome P450 [Bombardia bombarda]|uniref:Cytochrome P450 n=1 Tax=Bombardia bombarda TaxID=252184 RepID=A0AA39XMK9_9PEZI|nr:cytochrome P450 [Bombardia bombarda]
MPLLLNSFPESLVGEDKAIKTFSHLTWSTTITLIVVWFIGGVVYNLFFHPLRNFPGPLMHRALVIPFSVYWVSGKSIYNTQKLHEKYGPVVRLTPGHFSFCDSRAFKDMYGYLPTTNKGGSSPAPEMDKTRPFNRMFDALPLQILNACLDEHRAVRRALSHGFTETSLRQQEIYIIKIINHFYNYVGFDLTDDLSFETSLRTLDGSPYRSWVHDIMKTIKSGTYMQVLSYVGLHWLVQVFFWFFGHKNLGKMNRLLVLAGNAFILVLGGSETTATVLSGVTYLLTTHPEILAKLNDEVRSAVASPDDIAMATVGKLPYLHAVLNEALRMFPPVPTGLAREVPVGGGQIAGHSVPEGTIVEVQQWSINHSSAYWKDPWTFNPDRFLAASAEDALEAGNVWESLQPFSFGPKELDSLARAVMRLILTRIVYDFDLRLAGDSEGWMGRQKVHIL